MDMPATTYVTKIEGTDGFEILTRFADHKSGILLCLDGAASFSIGTRNNDMLPGDMLIIVPFSNLEFTAIEDDFRGTLCIVEFEYVLSAVAPIRSVSNMQFVTLHPLSHPSDSDLKALITLIDLIEQRHQFIGERPLAEMTISNLLHVLAYLVMDTYLNVSQTETPTSDTKESIMMNFHSNLSRDFATHRTVSYYARLQNLTTRYFSSIIKGVSGNTPLYWINIAVAAEAKRLMRNSKMSIKEIAYKLNFTSPTFFTRWFREFTGETPSQYRSRYRITLKEKLS